jgi:phosphoesterase RecJ-like protein
MNKAQIATAKRLLATPKKIVIIGHKNPDGDAVGSTSALSLFLKSQGHDTQVIVPNDFPDFLKWMPASEDILIYNQNIDQANQFINDAAIICTLDFNSFSRVGNMQDALTNAKADYIMIDHHQSPDDYAVLTYSDTAMGSTCEMVYHFIAAMGDADKISEAMATNIYTGIMTDTGSFRFASTTAQTHNVIAHLKNAGIKHHLIHEQVYDSSSPERLKLLGIALNNMQILPEYKTAFIGLSQQELDDNKFQKGDTEGFVNYALSVKGIIFAAIFIEDRKNNIVKISLRSKGDFNVNLVGREHFHGGGHNNAAGGKSDESLQDTISYFISILPHYKDQLLAHE